VPAAHRRVVLAANSGWNIVNFRGGLIRALKAEGYEPVVVAPADPSVEARMEALEVERIAVPIDRSGMNALADLRLLAAYRAILGRTRPAAFLGFTIKPNIYGCLAASALGIPAIPNVSGLGTAFIRPGMLSRLVTSLYRFAFRRVAVVFFQNPDDLGLFVDRRIVRPNQARLLPGSGIDLDRFKPSPFAAGPMTFLFVGRLLGDKGVREYVAAARRLRDQLPEARFQLLGPLDEGNRTAISRRELDEWVAEGVVEYLGATEDPRPAIAAASAIVLPSYREGLPRSLLEAAAVARPLIATDVPGCREVVEDGVNGLLCTVRDPESLASAMKRLAEMPDEARAAMGAAARRRVEERFSERIVIHAYLAALGEVERPGS
jgi:glycosyltransferase involved in cell wall biosynthesis